MEKTYSGNLRLANNARNILISMKKPTEITIMILTF